MFEIFVNCATRVTLIPPFIYRSEIYLDTSTPSTDLSLISDGILVLFNVCLLNI